MSSNIQTTATSFLMNQQIEEFNEWRLENLTVRFNLDGSDLSNLDLSSALLNGVSCIGCNFSRSKLRRANIVQSDLSKARFENSDLSTALMMYSDLTECNLSHSDLTRTNLMWSNLSYSDLSYCVLTRTILVESNMSHTNLTGVEMSTAFLKYAKIDSTKSPI